MSRVRFLTDEDLKHEIAAGLLRAEPAVELVSARDVGLAGLADPEVLEYAAKHRLVVVSHDSNTMTGHASQRVRQGLFMPGLIIVPQWMGVGAAVRYLLMTWQVTDAEELSNEVRFAQLLD